MTGVQTCALPIRPFFICWFTEKRNGESNVWCKTEEKKRTEDVMEMLGLKETVVQMAMANGVRWYGNVLRRDDGHVLEKRWSLK